MKKCLSMLLIICMVGCFVACGNEPADTPDTENKNTEGTANPNTEKESESTPEDDGKIAYSIKIVDEAGAPLAGVMVQLCNESSCFAPKVTDANGIATYSMEEGAYKAAITTMPAGYEDCAGEYFYFEGDATEVVITLKQAK